jgi:hypothetical protein
VVSKQKVGLGQAHLRRLRAQDVLEVVHRLGNQADVGPDRLLRKDEPLHLGRVGIPLDEPLEIVRGIANAGLDDECRSFTLGLPPGVASQRRPGHGRLDSPQTADDIAAVGQATGLEHCDGQ